MLAKGKLPEEVTRRNGVIVVDRENSCRGWTKVIDAECIGSSVSVPRFSNAGANALSESDTYRKADGLMSGAASKAVSR
jgi:hypothetical protein